MRLGVRLLFLLGLARFLPAILAADLEIRVQDSQNGAIANASVVVFDGKSRAQSLSGATDATGLVRFPGQSLSFPAKIRVAATGFETLEQTVAVETPDPVDIHLRPAMVHTTVDVVVTDAPNLTDSSERTALEIARTGACTVYDALDRLLPSAPIHVDAWLLLHGPASTHPQRAARSVPL